MFPIAADSFAVVRPRRTFGIAIAAKTAMIATTITMIEAPSMISMRVNPASECGMGNGECGMNAKDSEFRIPNSELRCGLLFNGLICK